MRILAVVLALLAALAAAAWYLHHDRGVRLPFLPPPLAVTVLLPSADDLEAGAAVTWNGIRIGRVSAVQASPAGAQIAVLIDADYRGRIPGDCTFLVDTEGVLDRRTELELHVLDPGSPALVEGAVVQGVAGSLELTLRKGKRKLDRILDIATESTGPEPAGSP